MYYNFISFPDFICEWYSEEAAVLAKWLKGVTLAVAEANPTDEHAAFFGLVLCNFTLGCSTTRFGHYT